MKTWFNGLAREVLTGEVLPVSEPSVATGSTVANFQLFCIEIVYLATKKMILTLLNT